MDLNDEKSAALDNPGSQVEHRNADGVIYKGEGLITGMWVTGIGGATSVAIHDGENVTAPIIGYLAALENTTSPNPCAEPIRIHRGIYLNVADGNAYVTVMIRPYGLS